MDRRQSDIPVAWRFKERINDEFDTDWILTKYEPADGVRIIAKEPLYPVDGAAPALIAENARLREALPAHRNLSGIVAALRRQKQIDEEGDEVGVSRQAADEAATIVEALAALAEQKERP